MKQSIHRALSRLKTTDNKLKRLVESFQPVQIQQAEKKILGIYTKDEFSEKAKSTWQSILDLMENKKIIKTAIVKSNAEVVVKIGGREMTVADAITEKEQIENKKKLVEALKSIFKLTKSNLERNNVTMENNLQKLLETSFGKDNVKTNSEDVSSMSNVFHKANEWKYVDPLNLESKITEMEKEIEDFESEVDAVLSESNARTEIEVPEDK